MAEFHRLNNWSTRLTNLDNEASDTRRQVEDLEKWPSKVGIRYPHRASVPKKRQRGSLLRYHEAEADGNDVGMETGEDREQAEAELDLGDIDKKNDEGYRVDVSGESGQVVGGEKGASEGETDRGTNVKVGNPWAAEGGAEYLFALTLIGGSFTKLVSLVKNVASVSGGATWVLNGESAI
ncbi:hypothetical protein Tdes44962_MAKER06770 [Teratosphaeria destructans]|uniref:Uncharacterized protein n=1 Tax=Teratosphaeria destructans TaxID=418781 RepID=A0A9W7W708_9PEZI|nr:hypothetical protein Tdes44962_MAKER06770 [Teratosphaeria destructans]